MGLITWLFCSCWVLVFVVVVVVFGGYTWKNTWADSLSAYTLSDTCPWVTHTHTHTYTHTHTPVVIIKLESSLTKSHPRSTPPSVTDLSHRLTSILRHFSCISCRTLKSRSERARYFWLRFSDCIRANKRKPVFKQSVIQCLYIYCKVEKKNENAYHSLSLWKKKIA